MTAKFIGNGNGVVIICNHTAAPHKDADGHVVFHEGACNARAATGNILRSVNRKHAGTLGWFSAVIAGRQRDFCPQHAAWWKVYLAGAKKAADELKKRKDLERRAKEQAKRDAKIAREAAWKQKRDEKAAAKAERAATRLAKKAA